MSWGAISADMQRAVDTCRAFYGQIEPEVAGFRPETYGWLIVLFGWLIVLFAALFSIRKAWIGQWWRPSVVFVFLVTIFLFLIDATYGPLNDFLLGFTANLHNASLAKPHFIFAAVLCLLAPLLSAFLGYNLSSGKVSPIDVVLVQRENVGLLELKASIARMDGLDVEISRPVLLTLANGDRLRNTTLRLKLIPKPGSEQETHLLLNPEAYARLVDAENADSEEVRASALIRNAGRWTLDNFWYYPDPAIRMGNRVAALTFVAGLAAQWIASQLV